MRNYACGLHLAAIIGTGIVPASTVQIVAGLYIARPPITSFAGINFHPTAVLICPFIGSVANTGFGVFQWKSPLSLNCVHYPAQ